MRKPISSPAAVAAGMAEVRPQYGTQQAEPSEPTMQKERAFDHSGLLAIDPEALGFLFAAYEPDEEQPFEMVGALAIVKVDGPMSQSAGWWWDGYDAICKRLDAAFGSEAKTVCLKINSPGGDVAGCFEACDKLRRRAKDKPLVAYVDGMATSAGYALACSAEKIYVPASGRVGSVGVIARLTSIVEAMKAEGYSAAVITSGARKSDGHPMVPITDAAVAATGETVNRMADVFFKHVSACRKMKPEAVKALEAGVFVGQAAVDAGLADSVVGCFDDVLRKHGGMPEPVGSGASEASAESSVDSVEATHKPADGQSAFRGTAVGRKRNAMRDALVLALGLKAEAEEVDVLGAVTALQNDRREVLSLTGKPSMAEALGTIQGWRASSDKLHTVEARVAELEARDVERERDAMIAANERKISPAMLDWAKAQSVDALKAFLAVAPDLIAAPTALPTAPKVSVQLTPSQRKAAASAGMTDEQFAAELARLGGE